MKIITRLMEDDYVSYSALCKQQGALAAEAIWQELEAVRKENSIRAVLRDKHDYLCFTPFVIRRQKEVLSLLLYLQLYYRDKKTPLLAMQAIDYELQRYSTFYHADLFLYQELQKKYCDLLLVLFCLTLLPESINQQMVRLWKQLVIPQAPMEEHMFFVDEILYKSAFLSSDKTYLFLLFLTQAELKFEECLLLLKSDSDEYLRMTKEQLEHRFPQFSEQQIAFFVTHREQNAYYSIQEYKEYANVCYETARTAMEDFVKQGWYWRRKIGKRFYYTTIAGH